MRRDRPRTGAGISRFGKARCFASARGQPPSTGRPNRRQRNSRSAGPSLFRVPSGGIFCPGTRRKSRCFSPSAEFSRPHWKDGRAGVPDHDIGQRNFFCRHHAGKPGYSREHHGRQRMRDGVHRGGMPARARPHQVDGIRRARHRILEKGMGQLCRGARKQDRVAARERRPFPIRFTTAVEP